MKVAGILTTIAAMGGLALATPDAAMAQQPVPQEQEAVEVTEELLDRFVAVYPSIVEIAQGVQTELAVTESAEEAQAIQADAQAEITTILDEGDMTVVEYEAVVTRLNDDPELMAEVEARLMEQAEEDGTLPERDGTLR